MKILALASEFDLSEAHLLSSLASQGHKITAVVSRDGPGNQVLRSAPIEISELPFSSRVDLKSILTLKKIMRENSFDIVHCFAARALTCALFAGVPSTTALVAYRGTIGRLGRWDPISYLSFFNPRVDAIICVSSAVKRFLGKYLESEKLSVVHKGHDANWYLANLNQQTKVDLTSFGLKPGAHVIACVANDRPVKGLRFAVEALEYLPENVHLLIVGRISGALTYIESSPCRERIHLAGFQKHPELLLAASNVLVVPSIAREGLPRVLIEGWSTKVPIIATAVGGIPEVIVDKHSGLLVRPKSGVEIALAVEKLQNEPELASKLTANGLRRLGERFNAERTVLGTLEVYKRAVKG